MVSRRPYIPNLDAGGFKSRVRLLGPTQLIGYIPSAANLGRSRALRHPERSWVTSQIQRMRHTISLLRCLSVPPRVTAFARYVVRTEMCRGGVRAGHSNRLSLPPGTIQQLPTNCSRQPLCTRSPTVPARLDPYPSPSVAALPLTTVLFNMLIFAPFVLPLVPLIG